MSKQVMISPTMQYIIDRVREIRIEFGLTQRVVSRFLTPESDSNLLGNIESPLRNASYTDHNLNILAKKFSEYSGRDITIYDFYPPQALSDVLQVKTKTTIFKNIFPTGCINVLIEDHNFFNIKRSVKEITDFANNMFNKNWRTKDFNSPLDRAVEKGSLKKIEIADGGIRFLNV